MNYRMMNRCSFVFLGIILFFLPEQGFADEETATMARHPLLQLDFIEGEYGFGFRGNKTEDSNESLEQSGNTYDFSANYGLSNSCSVQLAGFYSFLSVEEDRSQIYLENESSGIELNIIFKRQGLLKKDGLRLVRSTGVGFATHLGGLYTRFAGIVAAPDVAETYSGQLYGLRGGAVLELAPLKRLAFVTFANLGVVLGGEMEASVWVESVNKVFNSKSTIDGYPVSASSGFEIWLWPFNSASTKVTLGMNRQWDLGKTLKKWEQDDTSIMLGFSYAFRPI